MFTLGKLSACPQRFEEKTVRLAIQALFVFCNDLIKARGLL